MSKLNAKITNQTGSRVGDYICFEAESSTEITLSDAMEAQRKLGYDPRGYGFEFFKIQRDPILLRYKATWKCQGNCD